MTLAATLLASVLPASESFWEHHRCELPVPRRRYYRLARPVLRAPWPPSGRERTHLVRLRDCAPTARSARLERRWTRRAYRWRTRHRWPLAWLRLPANDRSWAEAVTECESGGNPRTNTGNGYYGAFQFMLPTAQAAGFTRRPDLTSWHEQAVRAVWWSWKAGRSQWACP